MEHKAHGFTDEEKAIINDLVEIHNKYISLECIYPADPQDWVNAMHKLQDLIALRAVRRDYPEMFNTAINPFIPW